MSTLKKSAHGGRLGTGKVPGRQLPAPLMGSAAAGVPLKASPGKTVKTVVAKKVVTSSRKARVAAAVKKAFDAAHNSGGPMFEFSVNVDPFVDTVRRKMPLKPRVARELRQEFAELLAAARPRSQEMAALAARWAEDDPVLTTQEAADLVHVSRPFMVARIDAGDIPLHQQVGNQRRVRRSAVLAWQERSQQQRREAMRKLAASIEDEYEG